MLNSPSACWRNSSCRVVTWLKPKSLIVYDENDNVERNEMAFDVKDYLDFVRLLQEHPEWRAELRRLVLTDELLTLPELVRELADAQRRTEERVGRLEERVGRLEAVVEELVQAQRRTEEEIRALAEAQRRTEERVSRLEAVVEELAEAQRRTEERMGRLEAVVEELAEAQRRTEERVSRLEAVVEELAEAQRRTEERVSRHEELLQALLESHRRLVEVVGDLKGRMLELTYRDRATSYFGPLLRRMKVVDPYELEETLRAHLSEGEFRDVLRLDLLVCGQPRVRPEMGELWLAVEISSVVDRGDVKRAEQRATALRRAGYRVVPVVAGERLTQGAEEESRERRVVIVRDGQVHFWEEALNVWVEGA